MRMAIYARASTGEQSPELRDYAKRRGLVVHRAYVDHTGGEVRRRRRAPAFEEPMADARRRCFDCVLVGKYDRFARSLGALVTALPEFRDLGVDFMRRAPRVALSCRSVIPGTAALGLDGPGPHPWVSPTWSMTPRVIMSCGVEPRIHQRGQPQGWGGDNDAGRSSAVWPGGQLPTGTAL